MSISKGEASHDGWTWIDPCDPSWFQRRRLQANASQRNEKKLENILRIADRVFDNLSVMEQFYAGVEGAGRAGEHARADRALKVEMPDAASHLAEAERQLWSALEISTAQRQRFLQQQTARQVPAERARGEAAPGFGRLSDCGLDQR